MTLESLTVYDSHTEGEPTRVVLDELALGAKHVSEKADEWRGRLDGLRRALCLEPRGNDVIVGAHVSPPTREGCTADVVFFNSAGVLGMCGHGTIGVVTTLARLGRIAPGLCRLNTPVGEVEATLLDARRVAFTNVRSYHYATVTGLVLPDGTRVDGDVVYGGNWFFLASSTHHEPSSTPVTELAPFASMIMDALSDQGVTGEAGARIEHIELFGRPRRADADSLNFVLCPGRAFDRSPCGTGTSAKLASLAHHGTLTPGKIWRQEGIAGGVFEASYAIHPEGGIVPTITGSAYPTAESKILFDAEDPMTQGLDWA